MQLNEQQIIDLCGLIGENGRVTKIEAAVESIDSRLTTWVNPIIAVIISALTALLGFSIGYAIAMQQVAAAAIGK